MLEINSLILGPDLLETYQAVPCLTLLEPSFLVSGDRVVCFRGSIRYGGSGRLFHDTTEQDYDRHYKYFSDTLSENLNIMPRL